MSSAGLGGVKDCGSSKGRRLRTIFSGEQIRALEHVFQLTHYPDVGTRARLAHSTGLADARVQVRSGWGQVGGLWGEREVYDRGHDREPKRCE